MDDVRKLLQKLDPKNDAHWTGDGLPRLDCDVLNKAFTRQQVTRAAPLFNRANLSFQLPPDEDGDDQVDGPVGHVGDEGEDGLDSMAMQASEFGGTAPIKEDAAKVKSKAAEAPSKEELADAKQQAEKAIEQAQAARDASERAVLAAQKARDAVVEAQQTEYDPRKANNAVFDYLRSVTPHTVDGRKVDPPLLSGQSKLDQVLSKRRPGHGDVRRPPMPPLIQQK